MYARNHEIQANGTISENTIQTIVYITQNLQQLHKLLYMFMEFQARTLDMELVAKATNKLAKGYAQDATIY